MLRHIFSKSNKIHKSHILSKMSYSDTNSNLITVTKQKHLFLIGINRPEKRNAINKEISELLKKAFETFEKDDEAYVAVLFGKGGNFCSGFDTEELAEKSTSHKSTDTWTMDLTQKLLKKPVVAAINGYATGVGFDLALWCDLRVIEETAVMGFLDRRFGMSINNGSTVRLPHLVGLSRALDLIITGRSINAKEAYEIGLASKVTACGTSIGNAINFANSLCKFPQECLRADRLSTYHATYDSQSLEEALKFEFENSLETLQKESVQGAETFVKGVGRHGTFHLDALEKSEI